MRCTLHETKIITTLIFLFLYFALSIPPIEAQSYNKSATGDHLLSEGDYLEYHLRTQIIVLWNYTLEDNSIITYDNTTYRKVISTPALTNEIRIRLEVLEELDDDSVTIEVSYYANPIEGYKLNHTVLLEYSPKSGLCSIMNGTLEGYSGILHLFSNDDWSQVGSIVSLLNRNVTIESIQSTQQINIIGSTQLTYKYECCYYDAVDGKRCHYRFYDCDSGLLLRASAIGGITDRILLGLANISYTHGTLVLIATNLDIGIDSVVVSIGIGAGVSVVCVMAILIWIKWRKSKQSVTQESEFYHPDDIAPISTEPPKLIHKIRSVLVSHRKSFTLCIFAIITLGPMIISWYFYSIQQAFEEPPIILYKTSPDETEIVIGKWRYGEFFLSSPPSDKENYVIFTVSILDWHNCPSPVQMLYRISRISVQDFIDMLESDNETIPADGMYINEDQWPGASGRVLDEGQYLWYYSFITPYYNTTSITIEAEITISLTVQNPS